MNTNARVDLTDREREIIKLIVRTGGGAPSEIAQCAAGVSPQAVIAVAKKVAGRQFAFGRIDYLAPLAGTWAQNNPGIANPRNGYGSRVPAEIVVKMRGAR